MFLSCCFVNALFSLDVVVLCSSVIINLTIANFDLELLQMRVLEIKLTRDQATTKKQDNDTEPMADFRCPSLARIDELTIDYSAKTVPYIHTTFEALTSVQANLTIISPDCFEPGLMFFFLLERKRKQNQKKH